MRDGLRRRSKDLFESSVFRGPPTVRQITIIFHSLVDFAHQNIIYKFRAEHFFQQFVPMPDRNIEILGKQVHAEVIGRYDGRSNLTEGENEAIGR